MITSLVVDYTKIDVGEEFACNIGHLLMPGMIVNGVPVERGIVLTKFHVVNTDAIVCKCFSVHITNGLAHLQELFVGFDGQLELAEVIVQNTS